MVRYRQTVEWELPGVGRGESRGVVNGYRVSDSQAEKILETLILQQREYTSHYQTNWLR